MARSHPGEEPEGDDPISRELRIAFGRSVREARRRTGVTQVQLAARLGISQPQLSRIERGERNVTIPAMAAIARALGYRLTVTLDPPPDLESNNAA